MEKHEIRKNPETGKMELHYQYNAGGMLDMFNSGVEVTPLTQSGYIQATYRAGRQRDVHCEAQLPN